jgi:hypothetical protein
MGPVAPRMTVAARCHYTIVARCRDFEGARNVRSKTDKLTASSGRPLTGPGRATDGLHGRHQHPEPLLLLSRRHARALRDGVVRPRIDGEPYRAVRYPRSLRACGHRRLICKGSRETGNGDRAKGGDKGAFQPRHRDLLGFPGHPKMPALPSSPGGNSARVESIDDQVSSGWDGRPTALRWRVGPEPDRSVSAQLALRRGSHGYWAGNDRRENGEGDRAADSDKRALQPGHRDLPRFPGHPIHSSRPVRGGFMSGE